MVFFHLKGKTSILGLLLMKGDKEAEITVMLLLYEVCRKYYEVQGSYVEITSTALVCCWSYVYPFGNCERRADRGKKIVQDFANVEGFIVHFQFIHGTTLLFSEFTVRALVNRFPNYVWVTDVI